MSDPTSRDKLIRTASNLFRQKGYSGVGLSELLKEAGLPKGSLYYHFPGGKRQLAEADDPVAFRAELMRRIESARGPMGPLNRFEVEELIDPRDTRRYVCEWIENATRIATHPNRLAPPGERR